MRSRMLLSIAVATAMLLPVGYVSVTFAQDPDRDQLEKQQQLQDRDTLQTKEQLKEQDQMKEQEKTKERMRDQVRTERPDRLQHERTERPERGGAGGRR